VYPDLQTQSWSETLAVGEVELTGQLKHGGLPDVLMYDPAAQGTHVPFVPGNEPLV